MKVFLPCRRGSQRVPKKNVRPFGPFSGGLVELKLTQLLRVPEIDEILFELAWLKENLPDLLRV